MTWVKIPRGRNNGEGILKSLIQQVYSMLVTIKTLYCLPDMEGAVSCGAGIALSLFIPYYVLFVSN